MTNLEFAVMESERYGEIDVETRDTLLSILESAQEEEQEDFVEESEGMTLDEVKMCIYESELAGEITAEEREELIRYAENEAYVEE